MTSQVAVFNQLGIAVASDTILSVERRSGARRTYENRSKLVDLGGQHKVLIATNGNAVVNDVDISLVLREWSQTLDSPLKTLQEYVDVFRDWFSSPNDLLTEESETDLAETILRDGFAWMEQWVTRQRRFSESKRTIEESPLAGFASHLLETYRSLETFDGVSDQDAIDYLSTSTIDLLGIITDTFGSPWEHLKADLNAALPVLLEMAPLMLSRVDTTLPIAGMAFIGYGSSDYFPISIEITTHGRISEACLLWTESAEQGHPGIRSFAQDDAVRGFLWGASGQAVKVLTDVLEEVILESAQAGKLDPGIGDEIRDQWRKRIWEELGETYRAPLNSTVSSLSLQDLARLAESLVGIEALRANASPNPPGVGGLIETAVIDRFDGVQWIRRLAPDRGR